MKVQLLALALLAPALAWGAGKIEKQGVDQHGQRCSVTIENSVLSVKLRDYTFRGLSLEASSQGMTFEDTTMDYGNGVYARVIGAPITISSIGLIHVKGSTDLNSAGQLTHVKLHGKGGLANWWSRSFECKDLR